MDGEGSVDKYVKTEDVALTQAFTALFGVFMETLKVCVLFDTNTTLIVTEWFLFSSTLVTSSRYFQITYFSSRKTCLNCKDTNHFENFSRGIA